MPYFPSISFCGIPTESIHVLLLEGFVASSYWFASFICSIVSTAAVFRQRSLPSNESAFLFPVSRPLLKLASLSRHPVAADCDPRIEWKTAAHRFHR
jgi:hypothetical protein